MSFCQVGTSMRAVRGRSPLVNPAALRILEGHPRMQTDGATTPSLRSAIAAAQVCRMHQSLAALSLPGSWGVIGVAALPPGSCQRGQAYLDGIQHHRSFVGVDFARGVAVGGGCCGGRQEIHLGATAEGLDPGIAWLTATVSETRCGCLTATWWWGGTLKGSSGAHQGSSIKIYETELDLRSGTWVAVIIGGPGGTKFVSAVR
jgi:hypothetical protein